MTQFEEDSAVCGNIRQFGDKDLTSVLGVQWDSAGDALQNKVTQQVPAKCPTKRLVTSAVAKLFDATGLLAPTILIAKLFIRKLRQTGLDWDEPLPAHLSTEWIEFFMTLQRLHDIRIDRWIGTGELSTLELHGFCDASERAYAAVWYARVTRDDGRVTCHALTAKTKVAPLKTVTIPRLELCGALLLVHLLEPVTQAFGDQIKTATFWTDSTIVLAWLRSSPHTMKTFIANRVSEIQEHSDATQWRHVPTHDNPADLASRGVLPIELTDAVLWWQGPQWLHGSEVRWPSVVVPPVNEQAATLMAAEAKPPVVAAARATSTALDIDGVPLHEHCSSIEQLRWRTAYVLRFNYNCRHNGNRLSGPLTRAELQKPEDLWIRQSQRWQFTAEIEAWKSHAGLPANSKLCGLKPFHDDNDILRISWRLGVAPMATNERHPIVLCGDSRLAHLLITEAHVNLLHGGTQLTTQYIRSKFWIFGCRTATRRVCTNAAHASVNGAKWVPNRWQISQPIE